MLTKCWVVINTEVWMQALPAEMLLLQGREAIIDWLSPGPTLSKP